VPPPEEALGVEPLDRLWVAESEYEPLLFELLVPELVELLTAVECAVAEWTGVATSISTATAQVTTATPPIVARRVLAILSSTACRRRAALRRSCSRLRSRSVGSAAISRDCSLRLRKR
jgi:hypothetical protein